jgi:hypothetical protein
LKRKSGRSKKCSRNKIRPACEQWLAGKPSSNAFHLGQFPHLHASKTIVGRRTMKFKKKELLLSLMVGTGLHLLNHLRERLPDNVDDIKDRLRETYDTASHRVSRATGALRGEEDSHMFGKVGALLIGVGIGVGIGLLVAPSTGEETRTDIADKVSDFGDKVRERTGKKPQGATGAHDE